MNDESFDREFEEWLRLRYEFNQSFMDISDDDLVFDEMDDDGLPTPPSADDDTFLARKMFASIGIKCAKL